MSQTEVPLTKNIKMIPDNFYLKEIGKEVQERRQSSAASISFGFNIQVLKSDFNRG